MAQAWTYHTRLLLAASVGLPLFVGCANPGIPKPPSLRLPEPPKHLAAERVGSRVHLTWTTSADTTDGDTMRGPISAVICRDDAPKPPPTAPIYPVPADPCKVVHEVTVKPGESAVDDELPATLTVGAPSLLRYRVWLFNVQGRSAGPAAPVYAAAGRAPEAVGPLSLTPERNAVLIKWRAAIEPTSAQMQLSRTLLANAKGPVAPKKPGKSPAHGSQSVGNSTMAQQTTLTLATETLADPGGMTDRGVHDGDTLSYTAQRVFTVKLTIPASTTTAKDGKPKQIAASVVRFELRGEPSPAATIAFHDTFPPNAPAGLVAVPGGGFGELPSIDLSWEANAELDVTGYNVYRADAGSGKFTLLTSAPARGPAYRDVSVKPGHRYEYRVTAVDQRHNESRPSSIVEAEVQ